MPDPLVFQAVISFFGLGKTYEAEVSYYSTFSFHLKCSAADCNDAIAPVGECQGLFNHFTI